MLARSARCRCDLTSAYRESYSSASSSPRSSFQPLQRLLKLLRAADERFEQALAKKLPRVASSYSLFKSGTSSLFVDGRKYVTVRRGLTNGEPLHTLRWHDLQVYREFPKDLLKVTPTLAIAALPFMTVAAAPIGLLFPKHLLCKHYWTDEQKVVFADQYYQGRRRHVSQIAESFWHLHSASAKVGSELKDAHSMLIEKLDCGYSISPQDVLCVRKLFTGDQPFSLQQLSPRHKWHLARSLGLRAMSLQRDAELLQLIDRAVAKEGSEELTLQELQTLCFHRGLSPAHRTADALKAYLDAWCSISTSLTESELSLLLHSPIFLNNHLSRTIRSS